MVYSLYTIEEAEEEQDGELNNSQQQDDELNNSQTNESITDSFSSVTSSGKKRRVESVQIKRPRDVANQTNDDQLKDYM